jgi:hypothetical protein
MRHIRLNLSHRPTARISRRGSIWPLLLAILGLLLAGIALAVDASLLWQARQELQVAADASSLATVQQLADDRMLLRRPEIIFGQVNQARHIAVAYASRNHVLGRPLQLEVDDHADPDLRFGFYDSLTQQLQHASPSDWDSPHLNAVEITARRTRQRGNAPGLFFARLFKLPGTNVAATATAILDRQVIGFRPIGGLNAPVMPIAMLSDPAGLEERSWEAQVDRPLSAGGGGQDQYAFEKEQKVWTQAGDPSFQGDGLPEFVLRLPLREQEDQPNGVVIRPGSEDVRNWLRQVATGIRADDLTAWDGQLTLGWDGLCPVPEGSLPSGRALEELVKELRALHSTGEARSWPLFTPSLTPPDQPGAESTVSGPTVLLRGFVAARIADVQLTEGDEARLIIVLQPTVLVTGTAVTQPMAEINPYLAKARLLK